MLFLDILTIFTSDTGNDNHLIPLFQNQNFLKENLQLGFEPQYVLIYGQHIA